VDALVDGDRTAQLQGAVAAALRDSLPGNRTWEADALSQFARLMRDIRNYGVHPRQVTDGDIELYFTEDKCGLLFLEALVLGERRIPTPAADEICDWLKPDPSGRAAWAPGL
jgi:hypothetical protein